MFENVFKRAGLFVKLYSMSVGNGLQINMWCDSWTTNSRPLRELIAHPLKNNRDIQSVANSSHWQFFFCLHEHVSHKMYCTFIQERNTNTNKDEYYWSHNSTGKFTVKSARKFISTKIQTILRIVSSTILAKTFQIDTDQNLNCFHIWNKFY